MSVMDSLRPLIRAATPRKPSPYQQLPTIATTWPIVIYGLTFYVVIVVVVVLIIPYQPDPHGLALWRTVSAYCLCALLAGYTVYQAFVIRQMRLRVPWRFATSFYGKSAMLVGLLNLGIIFLAACAVYLISSPSASTSLF